MPVNQALQAVLSYIPTDYILKLLVHPLAHKVKKDWEWVEKT